MMKNLLKANLLILLAIVYTTTIAQNTTVLYNCNIDCESCVDKIMKNIPYEKGVNKVDVNLEQKLVLIAYKQGKNSPQELESALEKLGYETTYLGNPIAFFVNGNCDMCKKIIEQTAQSVDGVTAAFWDVNKKQATVVFDNSKTDIDAIQNAITKAGYDTEKYRATHEIYNQLHSCCKYERK